MNTTSNKRARNLRPLLTGTIAAAIVMSISVPAHASEGGVGFYLLGSKTTMAGYVPPPGVYGSLSTYVYGADADIDIVNAGVVLSGDVDATAVIELPTALYVLDSEIAGGHLALSMTTPIGYKEIDANAALTTPRGTPFAVNYEADNLAFGDPVVGATLGWHSDKLHYSIGTLVNIPIGQWELGNPVSIGFHRWAFDTTGAVTYLNPATGLELSGAAGVTFNLKNEATDYKTGTELHFEFAAMKHLSPTTSLGLHGYAFEQVSGDSGTGAKLGAFKGEVFAIGPTMDHTFHLGQRPLVMNLRYFHEFGAKNRMEGDAVFLNFVMPLGAMAAPQH